MKWQNAVRANRYAPAWSLKRYLVEEQSPGLAKAMTAFPMLGVGIVRVLGTSSSCIAIKSGTGLLRLFQL